MNENPLESNTQHENNVFDLDAYIKSIKSTNIINWSEVVEKYNNLKPEYKLNTKKAIQRYVNAFDAITIDDLDSKDSQLYEGIEEIIDDAKDGRWARHDLSKLERSSNFTELELQELSINNKKRGIEQAEEIEDKKEEQKIMNRILKNYQKLFGKGKE